MSECVDKAGTYKTDKMTPQRFFKSIVDRGLLVYIMLLLLLVFAQFIIPGFIEVKNISSILKMASFTGVAAIGQTLVILLGGIDMSVSNVVTFTNIVAAQMMLGSNENIPVTILVVIIIGGLIGFANATGINYLKIPPMIMTLGVGTMIQGIAMLYSKGAPKGNAAPFIRFIVNDTIIFGVVSWIVIIWFIISIIVIVLLKYTIVGRKLYSVGTSSLASHFAGINSKAVFYACYIISGVTAALTGIMLAGYTGTASAEAGAPYSMNTIVAVVIGGTAMTGGKGGYAGTIAGAIIMTVLDSILTVINIPKAGRIIAQGVIILLMVMIYGRDKKRFN